MRVDEDEHPSPGSWVVSVTSGVAADRLVHDAEGGPETVKYRLLSTLLLNELQAGHRQNARQQEELEALRGAYEKLPGRVDALDARTRGAR